jgi:hypothetical protein
MRLDEGQRSELARKLMMSENENEVRTFRGNIDNVNISILTARSERH